MFGDIPTIHQNFKVKYYIKKGKYHINRVMTPMRVSFFLLLFASTSYRTHTHKRLCYCLLNYVSTPSGLKY